MSARVKRIFTDFTPELEIYSIAKRSWTRTVSTASRPIRSGEVSPRRKRQDSFSARLCADISPAGISMAARRSSDAHSAGTTTSNLIRLQTVHRMQQYLQLTHRSSDDG